MMLNFISNMFIGVFITPARLRGYMYIGVSMSVGPHYNTPYFMHIWDELNKSKAPVTPNGDATAFVQRSKNLSARCGVAAKHA